MEHKSTVMIMTPQFDRVGDKVVTYVPKTEQEFKDLETKTDQELEILGLCKWTENHWLYPQEYYNSIPDGFPIVNIFGVESKFKRGKTSSDMRYGFLAYGFIKK